MRFRAILYTAAAAIMMCGPSFRAGAQVYYTVTIDTSQIVGASGYAEFSLSDGTVVDSTGPSTANSVTLSNFNFNGGSAGSILPPNIGNASGNMNSSILLADGDPGGVADLAQGYTNGSSLSFDVAMTEVPQPGTADEFLIRLLDGSVNYYNTTDPSGNNAFLRVDITSSTLGISNIFTYAGSGVNIPAPTVTIHAAPVNGTPEPGTWAMLAASSAAGVFALRRRRRAS
jgi:PEP-CTERM motif